MSSQEEEAVGAIHVKFDEDHLFIELSDGRQIGLPFRKMKWLNWLANATVARRAKWKIEPYGYAVWWMNWTMVSKSFTH